MGETPAPGSTAALLQAVRKALQRSGMRRDDKALPPMTTAFEAIRNADAAIRAASRAVADVCGGGVPGSPKDVEILLQKLRDRMAAEMAISGLEGDVMGVFLTHTFESSLVTIKQSARLQQAASILAMSRAIVVEVPSVGVSPRLEEREHQTPIMPARKPAAAASTNRTLAAGFLACAFAAGLALGNLIPRPSRSGVASSSFWRQILDENDTRLVERECRRTRSSQDGRPICDIRIWSPAQPAAGVSP